MDEFCDPSYQLAAIAFEITSCNYRSENIAINTVWRQPDYYNKKENKVLSFNMEKVYFLPKCPQRRFQAWDLHSLYTTANNNIIFVNRRFTGRLSHTLLTLTLKMEVMRFVKHWYNFASLYILFGLFLLIMHNYPCILSYHHICSLFHKYTF